MAKKRKQKHTKKKTPISPLYMDRAREMYMRLDERGDPAHTGGEIWRHCCEEFDEHPARESFLRRVKRNGWQEERQTIVDEAIAKAAERFAASPEMPAPSQDLETTDPTTTTDRLVRARESLVDNISWYLQKTSRVTSTALEIIEHELAIHKHALKKEMEYLKGGGSMTTKEYVDLRRQKIQVRDLVAIAGLGRVVSQSQLNLVVNMDQKSSDEGAIYGWEDDEYPEPPGDDHIPRDGEGRIIDVEAAQ
jgi:hypothetical protein